MKKRFRSIVAIGTILGLCACANPYAQQIADLDARYAAGEIGRKKYLAERQYLEVESARVDRENAGLAIGAAAVGTAIAATAIAADHDHPHGPGPGPGPGPRPGGPPPR